MTRRPQPPKDSTRSSEEGVITISWTANTEADLAGYRLYRSGTAGTLGDQIGPPLITATEFADTTPTAGETYHYTVTALDDADNESLPSTQVPATGSALTEIRHCGALTDNENWNNTATHILDCTVTVPTGITLTVGAGTVVKVRSSVFAGGAGCVGCEWDGGVAGGVHVVQG